MLIHPFYAWITHIPRRHAWIISILIAVNWTIGTAVGVLKAIVRPQDLQTGHTLSALSQSLQWVPCLLFAIHALVVLVLLFSIANPRIDTTNHRVASVAVGQFRNWWAFN